ncbi:MAG: ISL3 family transposase [Oscillospiraceae bacterium]|jgi:transposase|nr:ISL3 family transposase [Oscillospiraceae bacterium]
MDIQTQIFTQALQIADPIYIDKIDFKDDELHIHLNFYRGSEFECAVCGAKSKAYDTTDKTWRHLNFFQYKCFLHFPTPRTDCKDCGIHQFTPPWARPETGFTLLFEAFVIMMIKGGMPFLELEKITGVYDTRLRRIVDYYVNKAYREKDFSLVCELGIDETSSKKGHNYVTVFTDLKTKEIIYVTPGKSSLAIEQFCFELAEHNGAADSIQAITMDMSKAFIKGASDFLCNAEITFDKFHVVKLLNEAVDKIRKAEVKKNPILKGTKWLWLRNYNNLSERQKAELQFLENENLDSAKAYRLKLTFQDIYNCCDNAEEAELLIQSWLKLADASDLEPIMSFAETIRNHYDGVMKYFKNRITSGICEGLNSVIQGIKRVARGYRNIGNFINMIYLRKCDLNLPRFPLPAKC